MFYTDGTDTLANIGYTIGFQHIPSTKTVYFKAFITAFNETYSPDWAEENVYGRADPIFMFKQTRRNITLSFKVPASSESEGFENLAKVQALAQFLYPVYTNVNNASTIAQSPLLRLNVMNLARSQRGAARHAGDDVGIVNGSTFALLPGQANSAASGLLGVLKNLTVTHNLENEQGIFEMGNGNVLPKLLEINLDFAVIHDHSLGWTEGGSFSNPAFPYGADLTNSTPLDADGLDALEKEAIMAHIMPQLTEEAQAADQAEREALESLNGGATEAAGDEALAAVGAAMSQAFKEVEASAFIQAFAAGGWGAGQSEVDRMSMEDKVRLFEQYGEEYGWTGLGGGE